MKSNIILVLLAVSASVFAQDSIQLKYANTITAEDLRSRLEIIASDGFEGRETGQPGQKKAANYIRDRFIDFGYKRIPEIGGYFQNFKLQLTYPDTVRLVVGADTLNFLKDMYYFPGFGDMLIETDELLYL